MGRSPVLATVSLSVLRPALISTSPASQKISPGIMAVPSGQRAAHGGGDALRGGQVGRLQPLGERHGHERCGDANDRAVELVEGFAAKAISVFKKIQKIDPSQRDVDAKLATLIQDKQRVATVPPPPAAAMPEFGMEEIGFEPEPASVRRADPEPLAEPEPAPPPG